MRGLPLLVLLPLLLVVLGAVARAYDPEDASLAAALALSPRGRFEAFYGGARAFGVDDGGAARPAHAHASYYARRDPALANAPNAAAYGFRFDGGRRFNYDRRR